MAALVAPAPVASAEGPDDSLAELTLEQLVEVQLVSAASKRPQSQREAPALVSIVNGDEMREHGYRTLADVLRSLPGFYVTNDRNYAYLGVRGFGIPGDYNTRVLVLVDGVRLNENIFDAAYVAHEFLLDPEVVERVEVSRGPGSAVYGQNALFAVVNVVTRRGRDSAGGRVSAEAASFGTWAGRARYADETRGGVDYFVSGSVLDSAGQTFVFPEFAEVGGGRIAGGAVEHARKAFASVGYRGLTLSAAHAARRKAVPTAPYGTLFGDLRMRTWDETTFVSARYERALGRHLDLLARVTYGAYDYRGNYPYALEDAGTSLFRDGARGRWWAAEANGRLRTGRHHLLFGLEVQADTRQDQWGGYEDAPEPDLDVRHRGRRLSVFAQDELALGDRVRLSLGGRFDHRVEGSQVSPRAALVMSPDDATTVKLLFGRAFRGPNEYEQHYYSAQPTGLRAETIETWEAALERTLGSRVRLVGSVFRNRFRDLLVLDATDEDELFFRNAHRLDTLGGELSLEARLRTGAALGLSYTIQKTRSDAAYAVTNSPRHMLKATLSAPLRGERLRLGADAQYLSARTTLAGTRTAGFVVANLTLRAALPRGLEASASAYNVFDTRYADPASQEHRQATIPQDGRSFRLSLAWGF